MDVDPPTAASTGGWPRMLATASVQLAARVGGAPSLRRLSLVRRRVPRRPHQSRLPQPPLRWRRLSLRRTSSCGPTSAGRCSRRFSRCGSGWSVSSTTAGCGCPARTRSAGTRRRAAACSSSRSAPPFVLRDGACARLGRHALLRRLRFPLLMSLPGHRERPLDSNPPALTGVQDAAHADFELRAAACLRWRAALAAGGAAAVATSLSLLAQARLPPRRSGHPRRLLAQAADHRAHAGTAGQDVRAAARLSDGAGARGSGRRHADGRRVRRQRPDVRRRVRDLHARRRRHRPARAAQPHQPLGGHRRGRQVRQADGLRRQADPAAHDPAARQGQHPHQRDRFGRRHQADRHQRRRRRRQARGVLQRRRRRPRRQSRARAERVRVGARQLDLQHLQLVPLPLDADRRRPRADRPERRPVGPVAGRRREDVVRVCGLRARAR